MVTQWKLFETKCTYKSTVSARTPTSFNIFGYWSREGELSNWALRLLLRLLKVDIKENALPLVRINWVLVLNKMTS